MVAKPLCPLYKNIIKPLDRARYPELRYKLNKILIVALAAMGFASAKAQTTLPGNIQEAVKENVSAKAVMENIMTRTSVRKFKQQPVEDVKIEALLRAGMAAPTASDMQPWHFVVLKDKQDIEKYAESNKYHAEDIKKTPLFIFVCADTTRMAEGQGKELWVQDLSAVSENILLAAHAMDWEPAGQPSILSRRK